MKRYLFAAALLLALGVLVGCPTPATPPPDTEHPTGYIDLSPAEALELINQNPDVIIIDVSPFYDDGHLPGAVHYYLGDGSLDAAIPTLDKNATYLVYCHVDSVAIGGAQALVDAGFTDVYRLEGKEYVIQDGDVILFRFNV